MENYHFLITRGLAFLIIALCGTAPPSAHARSSKLIQVAEGGDVEAQIRLGYEFRDGRRRRRDYKAAMTWFTKAADKGNPEAIDNIGWLHERGLGVPKAPAKARTFYLRASKLNHSVAQLNMARCLSQGIGGKVDRQGALKWTIAAFRAAPSRRTSGELAKALAAADSLVSHQGIIDELGKQKNFRVLAAVARIYHKGLGGIKADRKKAATYYASAREYGMPRDMPDALQLEAMAGKKAVAGKFGFLPTVHMDQGRGMCAPTAAAMALGYYLGAPPDPYAIKRKSKGSGPPGTGTCWDHMLHGIKAVTGHEWVFRSFPKTDQGFEQGLPILLGEVDARRPVLIDLGPHTVVLVGYDAGKKVVYIQNPAREYPGVHTVTYSRLKQKWHSPWHVSTTRGRSARPILLTGGSRKTLKSGTGKKKDPK